MNTLFGLYIITGLFTITCFYSDIKESFEDFAENNIPDPRKHGVILFFGLLILLLIWPVILFKPK